MLEVSVCLNCFLFLEGWCAAWGWLTGILDRLLLRELRTTWLDCSSRLSLRKSVKAVWSSPKRSEPMNERDLALELSSFERAFTDLRP